MSNYTTEFNKDKFQDKLNEKFHKTSWEDLSKIVDQIEKEIVVEIFENIKSYMLTNIPNAELASQGSLKIENYKYDIQVQPDIEPDKLAIGILPNVYSNQTKLDMINKTFTFENITFGRNSRYSIYLPQLLIKCIEPIQSITNEITVFGYSFYESILIEKIRDYIHFGLSGKLYDKLRHILGFKHRDYKDRLWFVIISDEKGYYLADSNKIEKTIDKLIDNRQGYNPSKVLTSFFTTILPFSIMNSLRLTRVNRGEILDFELEKSMYEEIHPNFGYSERTVYFTNKISAMMISDENEKLILSFPFELKDEIKTIFSQANMKMLRDIFTEHINNVNSRIVILPQENFISKALDRLTRLGGQFYGGMHNIPQIG